MSSLGQAQNGTSVTPNDTLGLGTPTMFVSVGVAGTVTVDMYGGQKKEWQCGIIPPRSSRLKTKPLRAGARGEHMPTSLLLPHPPNFRQLPLQKLRHVRRENQPGLEIQPRRVAEIGMRRPRVAVNAAMLAAAIRIHRPVETDIGRRVPTDG